MRRLAERGRRITEVEHDRNVVDRQATHEQRAQATQQDLDGIVVREKRLHRDHEPEAMGVTARLAA
jgi:hypothetical protein